MAGIKLLEEMGWTTDPELAELPYGLVDQMSSRSPEEQAALSIVCAPQISCGKTDVAMPNPKIDYCRQTPDPLIIEINCQG